MKMIRFIYVACSLSMLFVSCKNASDGMRKGESAPAINTEKNYIGTVPCADCAGIDLEVKLINTSDSTGNFWLKQTFKGTRDGDQSFRDSGAYSLRQGWMDDSSMSVYVFRPLQTEATRYFELCGDTALLSLGNDGERIKSELNYLLRRIMPQEK